LQTLLESTSWPVLTNYQVVKTWVTNWSCHPYPTSSLWWSKMKTTSICPSSRYDDNSFITWSSCYTSRRCSLFNDSGWPFESILICIASCYSRTCLHHQVSSYLSFPNLPYMMLYYHDGQRSHIALTITPVTRHLTLKFLPHTCLITCRIVYDQSLTWLFKDSYHNMSNPRRHCMSLGLGMVPYLRHFWSCQVTSRSISYHINVQMMWW
jgi:hypothetical protein